MIKFFITLMFLQLVVGVPVAILRSKSLKKYLNYHGYVFKDKSKSIETLILRLLNLAIPFYGIILILGFILLEDEEYLKSYIKSGEVIKKEKLNSESNLEYSNSAIIR